MATAAFRSIVPGIVPFPIPSPVAGLLARALGIDEVERVYGRLQSMGGERSIADRLLEYLQVSYSTSDTDLARIPKTGAAIMTVNHPFGILEGAILASLLGKIRRDVRFLANGLLAAIPELRELVIPVDPISGHAAVSSNGNGLRKCLEHLKSAGLLVIFPAGTVSHPRWSDRGIADPEWNPAIARLVAIAARKGWRATVVPAHVEGANSALFHLTGMAHPGFRTALLVRELLNKRGRRIGIRIGVPVTAEKLLAIPTDREQTEYLRWRTYVLGGRERFKPRTALPLLRRRGNAAVQVPPAPPRPAAEVAAEIAALPGDCLLNRSGEMEVYLAPSAPIPNVLHEIGRLREITFRGAGEGTGKALDLDEFDPDYLHLFVWNASKKELVGAYRLAATDVVTRTAGVRGLYTATLFQYGKEFLHRIGPALELGRSFVRQEYQRGFTPLLLLWKGIGTYVARNPRYKTLFGPVSISNRYQAVSRELMVSFLEKYSLLREWGGLVRHRKAFRSRFLKGAHRPVFPESGFDIEDLSAVVADLERNQTGVPVLLRQYLRLGGKLLGFNLDPEFSDALDGLILVDLTKTEPKLLERYLGRQEAGTFLEFQKGSYGTQ